MDADSLPIDFRYEQGRRLLDDLIAAGEGQSLGSLAADLDLTPPEALALLHRVAVQSALPIRAELDLHCPLCEQSMALLLGTAAWVMAGMTYHLPCACGRTVTMAPCYLEVLIKPDAIQPFDQTGTDARRISVAEAARNRTKALDRDSISAIQLSFDWGLALSEADPGE